MEKAFEKLLIGHTDEDIYSSTARLSRCGKNVTELQERGILADYILKNALAKKEKDT